MVVPVLQRETGETECVGEKAEDQKRDADDKVNDHERRDSSTPILKTSAVEPVCRHKTEEKGGGDEETWLEASIHRGKCWGQEAVNAKDHTTICGEEPAYSRCITGYAQRERGTKEYVY